MQDLHWKLPFLLEYSGISIKDTIKFENMLIFVWWLIFLAILIECIYKLIAITI